MPVVTFHLTEGYFTDEQAKRLLVSAANLYAEVLDAPMERIRAFVTPHAPTHCLVAGQLVSEGRQHAPYFEFIVLDGRPLSQRQRLMAGFTELAASILGVEPAVIRGQCIRVRPEEWGIGGVPASVLRETEIQKRKDEAAAGS
ncbi:MAG: tautomerase family protein [Gammaproteobacteria bacterium]|nr:tautomerase family protein [Gammaproteobacteria bacterium]